MRHHQRQQPGEPSRGRPGTRTAVASTSSHAQQFYEGGINVSAFGLNPCISTLLTDTRSSVSTTATLYDYALSSLRRLQRRRAGIEVQRPRTPTARRDAGEPGLADWTINLYKDTGTIGSYDGETVFRFRLTRTRTAATPSRTSSAVTTSSVRCFKTPGSSRAPTSAPPGETLVTNCPGGTNGYAFTVGGSDIPEQRLRQLPARSDRAS